MLRSNVRVAVALVSLLAANCWSQTFQTIHTFPANGSQGSRPFATLTIGPDGGLYGTASEGGASNAGTAFRYTAAGTFEVLGSFEAAETGKAPVARLVNLGDGFLYGASSIGAGTAGAPSGTVFRLDPAGGPTVAGGLTKIFALPGSGVTPMVPLSLASGEPGVLHVLGSSPGGIWRVPLDGNPPTNVFTLTESSQGYFPQRIVRGSNQRLYVVTKGIGATGGAEGAHGTVFSINPNGSGYSKLHDCQPGTGVNPVGALAEGPDGSFYGTMSGGGTNLDGVIFRISPSNEYTVLHHINDNSPLGDLLLASDGRLYGTSEAQGLNLYGSVFRINPDGTGFQVIHHFNKTNGAYPKAGLVQASDGNLYGVTAEGGIDNKGTIFRIDLNLPTPEVNRRPFAVNDIAFSSGSAVTINVLANDFDPDEDPLTVTIESMPSHGTAVVGDFGNITYSVNVGGGYAGFDEFQYKITDPEGFSAIATVTITDDALPPVFQPTVYNGILNLDPALSGNTDTPRGQLIINITQSGLFTGRFFSQGKRYPVLGAFDQSGTAVASVKYSKKNIAILFLARGDDKSLIAALFGQEQMSGFLSPILVPNPAANLKLTAVLESSTPDLPVGAGYATLRLLSNGLVVGVGKLGDGSKLVWGTTLVSIDESTPGIPVFNMPVRGGSCGGVFLLPTGSEEFEAQLRWSRPAATKAKAPYSSGFSGALDGIMATFTPTDKGVIPVNFGIDQAGGVAIVGPTINPGVEALVNVDGSRLIPNEPLKSFSINRSTGLFSGKMKVGTKTVGFKGAVIQGRGLGRGYYTIDKVTGLAAFAAE